MEQKIVVHTKAGKIFKGVTQDFAPERESFHFLPHEGGGVPVRLRVEELKALFWVKDYLGNRHFVPRRNFDTRRDGHRAIARFADGEEIWGTLETDPPQDEPGFFLVPADREDNNIRIYVVRSALEELKLM